MKAVKIRMILLLTILILLGILSAVDLIFGIAPWEKRPSEEGSPIIEVRSGALLSANITQAVADGENLYLVNGRRSTVQIYTLQGTYRYSISVFNHNNGRTQIAAHAGRLYIRDKRGNIYIFHNDEFTQFIDRKDSREVTQKFNWGYSDPAYQLRGGSVWFCPDQENAVCLISRPLWQVVFQSDVSWGIRFFLMIFAGYLLYLPGFGKRKTPTGNENEQLTGERK